MRQIPSWVHSGPLGSAMEKLKRFLWPWPMLCGLSLGGYSYSMLNSGLNTITMICSSSSLVLLNVYLNRWLRGYRALNGSPFTGLMLTLNGTGSRDLWLPRRRICLNQARCARAAASMLKLFALSFLSFSGHIRSSDLAGHAVTRILTSSSPNLSSLSTSLRFSIDSRTSIELLIQSLSCLCSQLRKFKPKVGSTK